MTYFKVLAKVGLVNCLMEYNNNTFSRYLPYVLFFVLFKSAYNPILTLNITEKYFSLFITFIYELNLSNYSVQFSQINSLIPEPNRLYLIFFLIKVMRNLIKTDILVFELDRNTQI